ncbi:MAG: DUF3352 domain-containing protein [Pirellulales bacterium]
MRLHRYFLLATMMLLDPARASGQEAAERPSAMKLFPADTFVFVRSPNARELIDKLKDSSTGRMAADPAVAPLLGDLYSSANELYEENVAEEIGGISLEELRELPQGEIAFGIVGRPGQTPAGLLLIDFGDQADNAKGAMEKLTAKAIEEGAEHSVEKIGGEDVQVWGPNEDQMVGVVQRGSVVLAANDRGVLARVLATWDRAISGESNDLSEPTLAQNANFVAVIRECYREGEPPPQLVLFVDPINMVKSFVPGNPQLRIAVATFPALGIDGLLALGATLSVSTENWDSLIHAHVLLDNPRAGVIRLFKFGPGKAKPPSYVPVGLETYTAIKIEPQALFDEIAKLVDKFRHEGSFRELVAAGTDERLGIKFEQELLPQLTGQTHWMSGFDSSIAPGGKMILAAEVVDAEEFRKLMDMVIAKYPDSFEERSFGGVDYHALLPRWLRDLEEEQRPFLPCVAIIGSTVVWSQSEGVMQQMIEAEQGTQPRLADSIEYRLVSSQLAKLARGFEPIWFSFRDNEATLEHWYGLATSERAQEFLTREQEDETANRFSEVFRKNQLPPFEVLAKYLAPAGSVAYDTDTGFHLVLISFRNE